MSDHTFDNLGHMTPVPDQDALRKLAKDAEGGYRYAIEVGTWAGETALLLASYFARVYCIDHWEGNDEDRLGDLATHYGPRHAFQTFCRNMGDSLFDEVFPCVGRSKTWAAIWPQPARLIFIDASHKYEDVRDDILAWRPHVAPGGVLVCHDYGQFPGVTRAVEELMPGFQTAGYSLAYLKC